MGQINFYKLSFIPGKNIICFVDMEHVRIDRAFDMAEIWLSPTGYHRESTF